MWQASLRLCGHRGSSPSSPRLLRTSPIQVKAQTWRGGYDRRHDHFLRRAGPAQRGVRRVGGVRLAFPFPASDTLQVLGCVDSRVDPSDVLGLKLGEGVVMRNIGGRITPATLRSWALLGRLGQGQPPRSGHLVILHHTDCGIRRLGAYPEQLAAFFEIPADELESKAVDDPYAAVRVDAAIARHTLPQPSCSAWSTTSIPGSSRSSTRLPRSSGCVQGIGHRQRRPRRGLRHQDP